MKSIEFFSAKILCFFVIFLIFTPNILAQKDSQKFTGEEISKARKGLKKWISESIIVALVEVGADYEKNIECFYGDDGKTIFTAVKFKVIHNYTENMRTINGEAVVIVKGGIIGLDSQFDFNLRPEINAVSLLRLDRPTENRSSKFNGLPAFEATSYPLTFQTGYGYQAWREEAYQFKSTSKFDGFVYNALGRTMKGKKKRYRLFRLSN